MKEEPQATVLFVREDGDAVNTERQNGEAGRV